MTTLWRTKATQPQHRSLTFCLMASMLTACNQNTTVLTSVQKMVQTTDAAAPSYAAIAADFVASCRRQRVLEVTGKALSVWPTTNELPTSKKHALHATPSSKQSSINPSATGRTKIHQASASSKTPAVKSGKPPTLAASDPPPPVTSPSPSVLPSSSGADPCATDVLASDDWQKLNVIVINYIDALGNLAGSGQSSNNVYGFDKLAASLKSSTGLPTNEVSTIQQLLSTVVRDIFASQRTDAIFKYAPEAKEALNNIIATLENIADTDYRKQLSQERTDIDEFYRDNMSTANPADRTSTIDYRKQWTADLNALDEKVAAINRYRSSLESLRSTHDTLVDEASRPNPDITSVVNAYVTQFLPDVQAIQQAFKK